MKELIYMLGLQDMVVCWRKQMGYNGMGMF